MYRACIFDLDGTLSNTLSSIAGYANRALKQCGYQPIPEDTYRVLVGNGADRLMRNMLDLAAPQGYSSEDVRRLRGVYDSLYESDCMWRVAQYDGVPELVRELACRGVLLAVLSNKPHNVTTLIVETLFGKGTFQLCYGQREGVKRKPSPEGALLIARELLLEPLQCLYIGDTDTDMKTGNAAGMDTVGVLWGFRKREELLENKAVYLAEKPKDILSFVFGGGVE